MKRIISLFILIIIYIPQLNAATVTGSNQTIQITSQKQNIHHITLSNNKAVWQTTTGRFTNQSSFEDGYYQYKVFVEYAQKLENKQTYKSSLDNGRSAATTRKKPISEVESGSFRINAGQLVTVDSTQQEGK